MTTVVHSIINIPTTSKYGRELSQLPLDQVKNTLKDLLTISVKDRTEQEIKTIRKISGYIQRLKRKDPNYKQKRTFVSKRGEKKSSSSVRTESTESQDSQDSIESTESTESKSPTEIWREAEKAKIYDGKPYPVPGMSWLEDRDNFSNGIHPDIDETNIPHRDDPNYYKCISWNSYAMKRVVFYLPKDTTETKQKNLIQWNKILEERKLNEGCSLVSRRYYKEEPEYLDEEYYRYKNREFGDWWFAGK
jgi:hypothetical protein